jgi:BirA family biotin operon repressor/biotin-[acetyl-CoA-carboxylase] ligase
MLGDSLEGLSEDRLRTACLERGLPWQVRVLPETGSTNDWLRDAGRVREVSFEVVFTENQTAGRGRRERTWEAPRATDLLFSLALRPQFPMAQWARLTQLTALAVCRAIEMELPLRCAIKWPNDVLIDGKKVCGILVESFGGGAGGLVVIGVGLNVNGLAFAGGLSQTASSLRLALESGSGWVRERGVDRNALAIVLLEQLKECLEGAQDDVLYEERLQEVRQRNWLEGKQVRMLVNGRECWGRVIGLDEAGALRLRLGDGTETLIASADQVRAVEGG